MNPRVLAIESSCDETAAAVVEQRAAGPYVLSSVVRTQVEVHAKFGGVVPELASRHHLGSVSAVVSKALEDAELEASSLDAIVVTEGPGLIGALLVGIQVGRGMATALDKPLIGVHHLEGHLLSTSLGDATTAPSTFGPRLALVVSGGHTELVDVQGLGAYTILGATRDDAVGEAYDKVAKLLGLGYPGGPVIDRLAREGNPEAHAFPRAMIDKPNLEFSFSGLKTAVLVHVDRHGQPSSRQELCDVCASFQAAVVDVLVSKTRRAVTQTGARSVHIVGGVAANSGLRAAMDAQAKTQGFELRCSALRYCGDNAAMIGAAGLARLTGPAQVTVHANRPLDDPYLRLDTGA